MRLAVLFTLALFATVFSGCYSLSGISIDPNASTYYVEQFDLTADDAPPTLPLTFTEALRDRIRTQTPLTADETSPDISFSGSVVGWEVTSEAPQPGETTAFNRLTITVAVAYEDAIDGSRSWRKRFPFFSNFSSTENLLDVQDLLIDEITEQLIEDVFNAAFTNW